MKTYFNFVSILLSLILVACGGIESEKVPTKEHPLSYHIEFDDKISKELPQKDASLLRNYMRRVKNIETGTTVGGAIEMQREYIIEQENNLASEKERLITEYEVKLKDFEKSVQKKVEQLPAEDKDGYQSRLKTRILKMKQALKNFKIDGDSYKLSLIWHNNKTLSDFSKKEETERVMRELGGF